METDIISLDTKSILQPKNDVVFKALFTKGKENITKALLEDILKIKIHKLDLDKSKDLINTNKDDKNGRLDLRAVINDNIECDIELQLKIHTKEIERFLYYWSKIYSSNLNIGEKYEKLNKTISIIILGENISKLKKIKKSHTKWQIREEDWQQTVLTNDLELHIIEMPKALAEYKKNPKDEVLQWMMFLDNPENMEVIKIMEENQDIKEAKNELNKISEDEELRRIALNRHIAEMDRKQFIEDAMNMGLEEGIRKGREEGIEEGELEEKIRIAKKLLKMNNFSKEQIKKITELSSEQLEKIINDNK